VSAPKQILVVHPSMALSVAVRRKLERSGYVVLVGEPDAVRVIAVEYMGSPDLLTRAALATIRESSGDMLRAKFAAALIDGVLAKSEAKP
jgi:hypothetical protein